MKKNPNLTSFEEILEKKYGKRGDPRRETYQQGYEAFKLGVLIEEARLKMNLTRQELADRAGTSKAFITRIENDASGIKLSTLMRIVNKGLGGKVLFSLQV